MDNEHQHANTAIGRARSQQQGMRTRFVVGSVLCVCTGGGGCSFRSQGVRVCMDQGHDLVERISLFDVFFFLVHLSGVASECFILVGFIAHQYFILVLRKLHNRRRRTTKCSPQTKNRNKDPMKLQSHPSLVFCNAQATASFTRHSGHPIPELSFSKQAIQFRCKWIRRSRCFCLHATLTP